MRQLFVSLAWHIVLRCKWCQHILLQQWGSIQNCSESWLADSKNTYLTMNKDLRNLFWWILTLKHSFADVKHGLIGVGMISYDERYKVASLEKDYNNISKFLNRILGMTVDLQNYLFKYFTDTLAAIILQAKRNGRWDMGILGKISGDFLLKIMLRCLFYKIYLVRMNSF